MYDSVIVMKALNKQPRLIFRKEALDELMALSGVSLAKKYSSEIGQGFDLLQDNLNRMTSKQQIFIKKFAMSDGIPIADVDTEMASYLLDTTLIVKDDKAGTYKVNGTLLKKGIVEEMIRIKERD